MLTRRILHSATMLMIARSILYGRNFCALASAASPRTATAEIRPRDAGTSGVETCSQKTYRTVQVQIVHRHGDRTPITPMKDEAFWQGTLVEESMLKKISSNTEVIRGQSDNQHAARGRGPFGKLTKLGLLQMVELGNKLREQLATSKNDHYVIDEQGNKVYQHVWTPMRPLTAENIRVYSTDFPRTIQSVQGLLVGLFPEGTTSTIPIDMRNTQWMIPDPQPRQSVEQEKLENDLVNKPYILYKEKEMLPLALRATKALHGMLGSDAHEFHFGVEKEHPGDESIEMEPLAWSQLSEITKCLAVRDMLPKEISPADQEEISKHAAWRWFETLRNPRLSYLAMNTFLRHQLDILLNYRAEPPVTIWSAHDSTLIGLMCAYRLEQPSLWPDYASYFMIELIEITEGDNIDHAVRFSLNGEVLRSGIGKEPNDFVSLRNLSDFIESSGEMTARSS